MNLGKVVGTVVSTQKDDGMPGARYLLVERTTHTGEKKGDYIVALDMVSAGHDELVLLSEGSPARETPSTVNKPLDALIVGIVDLIDENDKIVYKK